MNSNWQINARLLQSKFEGLPSNHFMRNTVLLLLWWFGFSACAEQILPSNIGSTPVQIQIPVPNMGAYNGTGVYLVHSNKFYLVTAAHVLFDVSSTNNLQFLGPVAALSVYDLDQTNKDLVLAPLPQLLNDGLLKRHPSHDVAVVQLGTQYYPTNGKPYIGWHNVLSLRPDGTFSVQETGPGSCKLFNDIQDGNETYVFGYPIELLNTTNMPSEVDFARPLIRKGIISQRNRQTGKIILDSGVYGGNSGGPIVIVERPSMDVTSFKIGGIITQFVPIFTRIAPPIGITNSYLVNSGYSVVEPIDYAIELMNQIECQQLPTTTVKN